MRGPYKAVPQPGTVADLVLKYRRSPRVLAWSSATSRRFDKILGNFMAANGRAMVADLRRGDIIAMRDTMAATPGEANNWLKVIRGLLDYAVDLEMIQHNPAARIKRLALPNPDGFRTWREDEIAAFRRQHPKGSTPHLALTLALCSGASRADLVRLGWQNIHGERLRYRRRKTGEWVDIPVLPDLAELLKVLPERRATFLETARGEMRTPEGLATSLLVWLEKAGLDDQDDHGHRLSMHGLRKALGRRLAEAGCTPHEVAAVLGHASVRSAEIYTKAYDRAKSAESGAEKLARAQPVEKVTRLRTKAARKGNAEG